MKLGMKEFYLIGASCFVVISFANLYNYVVHFTKLNLASNIASGANLIFNGLLAVFFISLYIQIKKQEKQSSDFLNKVEDELKNATRRKV